MEENNLWILTEEKPKNDVLLEIILKFTKDNQMGFPCSRNLRRNLRIVPIFDESGNFTFRYEILGIDSKFINKIYVCTVSGYSSFVDFLLFFQKDKPNPKIDTPLYAIEETKTDDGESRNTGVYQRASKFVYISSIFPHVKKIMLYSQVKQKEKATETNIFGTKCLLALGVEILILGKKVEHSLEAFKSIDELIEFKNSMRNPPQSNVPIKIEKYHDKITISGKLLKADSLAHDPNIGALSLICATIRKLGYTGTIQIVSHELQEKHIKYDNKFIRIANFIRIELEHLEIPSDITPSIDYWHYETRGEKLATIFLHLMIENFTEAKSIYENHAGCERGYFVKKDGERVQVAKDINIPDLVIADFNRKQIINIEGKQFFKFQIGIKELENFDAFEKRYIQESYPDTKIIRTVVLFGGDISERTFSKIHDIVEIGFWLTEKGEIVLTPYSPEIFKEAIVRSCPCYFVLNKEYMGIVLNKVYMGIVLNKVYMGYNIKKIFQFY